ncbi:MAG: 2,3-bisphosphoglycerate-independent phosphoglycerate mutase [Flavobacteriales bacterium]|nr:2,3-bisphosphoglycerate-independent phosphoglycerate mutase [Flavobacteriales bacterium]
MKHQKVALIVLDGWGIGSRDDADAVSQARTPFMDQLLATRPHALLRTDGLHVGLPDGQMGNSEVGHLNIGAGRVVHQDLVRIDHALAVGSMAGNAVLLNAFDAARRRGGRIHFMGLLSRGGVHSSQDHLTGLCRLASDAGLTDIVVHAFTDGRDADPNSGAGYMRSFLDDVKELPVRVASVVGRYYAMDRDKRWERVVKAYDLLVHGKGTVVDKPLDVFTRSYEGGISDEFIEPHVVKDSNGSGNGRISDQEVVVCFNFRTDRCREITIALTQQAFPEQGMRPLSLHYVTMTSYDPRFNGVEVIMDKGDLRDTLGEVIAGHGLRQLRAAETEKYPHVTFFFSGGREEPFEGEDRILVPSPKVATYDQQPEMSAPELAEKVSAALTPDGPDLVVLNFANPDMVGHTGVFEAIVKAVEVTDRCAGKVVEAGLASGYAFVIIADHGNADQARNSDGSANTAHSLNPVPIVVLDGRVAALRSGILADVAPTILHLMGLEQPAAMTGQSLVHMKA